MSTSIKVYVAVEASEAGKLLMYDGDETIISGARVDPTCISNIENTALQTPIWKTKTMLGMQIQKKRFREIPGNFFLKPSLALVS